MDRVRRLLGGERAADLLLWLVITAPVLVFDEEPPAAGLPLPWVRIAAVPLLALAVLVSRRAPVVAASVPPVLGLAATPELFTDGLLIAQVLLAYLLGRRSAGRRAALLLFAAVCAAGLPLVPVRPDGAALSDWFSLITNVLVTLVLPWLAGRYARRHAELVRTGWELAERLEREQELAGERVRLRERSRIATDMHDSLGHELSMIALRAAALQVNPGTGAQERRAAAELRQAAAAATERLREVIGVLREDDGGPVPTAGETAETVASLVARAAASGMAVSLDDALSPAGSRPLPPMTDRAVYRVVQEALTNATKHAPGAAVTVTLRRVAAEAEEEAEVTVANAAPPAGPPPGPGSGGYGLVGLDERVRLAGGTLRAQPVDGGFAVTARLPLTAGAASTPPGGAGASRRELALARRRVRRSMIDAIWVPAAGAVVLLLVFGLDLDAPQRPVLDRRVYEGLRIGEPRSAVENRLPAERTGGERHGDPPGADECRLYRTGGRTPSPAYQLCFTDGRLSHKDEVDPG